MRSLSDRQVQISVKLRGGEIVRGWIEYFDDGMLRLTREGRPNLFIYKHQIETITETARPANTAACSPAMLSHTERIDHCWPAAPSASRA